MQQDKGLKALKDLENLNFFIPNYQRGYRWGKEEINALLEDVWDFANAEHKDSFYCLQPIVVKKNDKRYNVIDGQQRLTTIFLIVKFLKNEHLFNLAYETRQNEEQDSREFLCNIESKSKSETNNIDFYHFYEAYQTIKNFFSDSKINKEKFTNTLLEDCQILWYELSKDESENEVFRRLNIGKIPLQEAENIKALFLSKNENLNEDDIKERAKFWYEAELSLREERDFRYCVLANIDKNDIMSNIKPYILSDDLSRIEVYLCAITPQKEDEKLLKYFYKNYADKKLDDKWQELESCVNSFQGFASKGTSQLDREIFHYIGFLTQNNEKISNIYKLWKDCNKSKESFAKNLFKTICRSMKNSIENIDDLDYREDDKKEIHALLLLANLQFLINDESSNKYFEFNRFILEQWSLEHIYAQNSRSIKTAIKDGDKDALKDWLNETKDYIESKELQREISEVVSILESNTAPKLKYDKNLEKLLAKIDQDFKDNNSLHKISNLSLLDKDSNAKLANLIFSKKRKKIEQLGKEYKLIPILTQKVFDKSLGDLNCSHKDIFNKDDQEAYLEFLKDLLNKFTYYEENK
ncbi:DUF262 domain-containing protein [Campylobacter troglodytis]|uniref:DUF262 domain-containing protein n=1 Tax=Campylobacter troglodytis TaxID=654363 RepID=UPI00115A0167|nr:DUF262 domain-containing protein [Campylobacter troglodytis]TQR53257.1 hypothetical protein DMC01_11515 [Campylobacter troglodytis]